MNNTIRTTLAIAAILAATLVVGIFAATTTTQSAAFAYKKGERDKGDNGNTDTAQINNQDPTQSGFDGSFEQDSQNDICTHPSASCEAPTTGTLLVNKICIGCNPLDSFSIQITGNNPPQPSTFHLTPGSSQLVTLGPGTFTILEGVFFLRAPTFSGDCNQVGPFTATVTISVGQHLTCTITNIGPV